MAYLWAAAVAYLIGNIPVRAWPSRRHASTASAVRAASTPFVKTRRRKEREERRHSSPSSGGTRHTWSPLVRSKGPVFCSTSERVAASALSRCGGGSW